jgi:F0F1-type ATP synthase assembly protein I
LLLLLGAVAVGCAAGFIGLHFTGSSAWFLAVPALVFLGWLAVANPTECLPPSERSSHNGSSSE